MEINQPKIKKTDLDKQREFFNAVLTIYDIRDLIQKGKLYQMPLLFGQLRALLADPTKKSKKRFIFEVAKILNEEIKIFYMSNEPQKESPFYGKSLLHFSSFISIYKQFPSQKEITLKEYLETSVLEFKGKKYTGFEIINELSDKYGGSHYDEYVPQDIAELNAFAINNVTLFNNYIMQITNLFIDIGLKLINKMCDFEFFYDILIPELSIEENFIFDYRLPGTNCRISLYTFQGKLRLFLMDIIGHPAYFETSLFKAAEKHLINISHRITYDLKSEVKVTMDGNNILTYVLPIPLMMINKTSNYECYYNKSKEKESQDFEFGILEINIAEKFFEDGERAKIYAYFSQRKVNKIIWFPEKSYGYLAPQTRDIKLMDGASQKDFPFSN